MESNYSNLETNFRRICATRQQIEGARGCALPSLWSISEAECQDRPEGCRDQPDNNRASDMIIQIKCPEYEYDGNTRHCSYKLLLNPKTQDTMHAMNILLLIIRIPELGISIDWWRTCYTLHTATGRNTRKTNNQKSLPPTVDSEHYLQSQSRSLVCICPIRQRLMR